MSMLTLKKPRLNLTVIYLFIKDTKIPTEE